MKEGTKINYTKFGIPSKAEITLIFGTYVIAKDGMTSIIFKKKNLI
jgi:hypothetical protein